MTIARKGRETARRTLRIRVERRDGVVRRAYFSSFGEAIVAPREGDLGDDLYEALFGRVDGADPLFAGLFRSPRAHATFGSLRVVILTNDAEVAARPWARTKVSGESLVELGWSFEIARAEDAVEPTDEIHLITPCRTVLAVGSKVTGASELRKSLDRQFDHIWGSHAPAYVAWSDEKTPLERAVAKTSPLVGIIARCRDSKGKVVVELEGAASRATHALAGMVSDLGEAKVTVLLLALEGLPLERILRDLLPLGAAAPPAVIVLPIAEGKSAPLHRLMSGLLTRDEDPAQAVSSLHDVASNGNGSLPVVITRFGAWHTTATPLRTTSEVLVSKVLDRYKQKETFQASLLDLASNPERRALAFVAFGEEGNLVEHFPDALVELYEQRLTKNVVLGRERPRLPRAVVPEDKVECEIDRVLRQSLGLDGGIPLVEALHARAPKRIGGRMPVLFLAWEPQGGSFGGYLDTALVKGWIDFVDDLARSASQAHYKLFCLLVLEVSAKKHEVLEGALRAHRDERPRTPLLDVQILPPLDRVEKDDLDRFLRLGRETSNMPFEYMDDLVPWILAETKGVFADTARFIEAGNACFWHDTHARLKKKHGGQRKSAAASGANEDLS